MEDHSELSSPKVEEHFVTPLVPETLLLLLLLLLQTKHLEFFLLADLTSMFFVLLYSSRLQRVLHPAQTQNGGLKVASLSPLDSIPR